MAQSTLSFFPKNLDLSPRRLKLDTLVRLRWLAAIGQLAAIVVVWQVFDFDLPVATCLTVIAVSMLINIIISARYPASTRLRSQWTAWLLALDLLQLSLLLYLTGGLENPFAFLLLGPVMISAMSLPPDYSILLGLLMVGLSSLLTVYHLPLPWGTSGGAPVDLPAFYVWGIWTAMMSCLVFIGLYAFRVATEIRRLADALSVTELALAREQHLSALDGLAAAAAHELGTPLATIALVSKELSQELQDKAEIVDDLELLRSQTQRCRDILSKLTSLSTDTAREFIRMPFRQMMEEMSAPHRDFGVDITIVANGEGAEPLIARNPAIFFGLGNIIENAVDYANTSVTVTAIWTDQHLQCRISDDGPGFPADILPRLGEPYLRTASRPSTLANPQAEAGGLGLGFFIAKTLLERSGAAVAVDNMQRPRHGAIVTVTWPRDMIEIRVETSHPWAEKLSQSAPALK